MECIAPTLVLVDIDGHGGWRLLLSSRQIRFHFFFSPFVLLIFHISPSFNLQPVLLLHCTFTVNNL